MVDDNVSATAGSAESTSSQNADVGTASNNAADSSGSLSSALLPARHNVWAWVSVVLGLGWFITLVAWLTSSRKRRRASRSDTIESDSVQTERQAMRDLKVLSRGDDRSRYLASLMSWASARWPKQPPVSVAEVGRRLYSDELSSQLRQLESSVYSQRNNEQLSLASAHQSLVEAIDRDQRVATRVATNTELHDPLPRL